MTNIAPIISVEHRDIATIVVILQESLLDDSHLNRLEDALTPILIENPAVKLIIDFHKVRALSSSILGFMVNLKKTIEKHHGRLILCCIERKVADAPSDRYVYELFKVVQLDRFFEIASDLNQAISRLAKATERMEND